MSCRGLPPSSPECSPTRWSRSPERWRAPTFSSPPTRPRRRKPPPPKPLAPSPSPRIAPSRPDARRASASVPSLVPPAHLSSAFRTPVAPRASFPRIHVFVRPPASRPSLLAVVRLLLPHPPRPLAVVRRLPRRAPPAHPPTPAPDSPPSRRSGPRQWPSPPQTGRSSNSIRYRILDILRMQNNPMFLIIL